MVLPHLRTALLLVLVALPAGCFGTQTQECSTCAQPTDRPAVCANCTSPPPQPPNVNDPGYLVTGDWHVGDGWDYYSNQSRYHSDRITDSQDVNGTTYFLMEQAVGVIGNAPSQRVRTWFDARNWTRVNVTYPGGSIMTNFTPPQPDRFFQNGTFSYNQSDGNRGTTTSWRIVVNAYFGDTDRPQPWSGYQKVQLPWGAATAGHMEYRARRTAEDGRSALELTIRYPSAEYGNDLQYQTVSGEIFKLVAYRFGDRASGQMIGR